MFFTSCVQFIAALGGLGAKNATKTEGFAMARRLLDPECNSRLRCCLFPGLGESAALVFQVAVLREG